MEQNNLIKLRDNPIISTKRLWDAMKALLYADAMASMIGSLQVNSFKEFSGDWVVTLEDRVEKFNEVGGSWHESREDIVANFLTPFITYSNYLATANDMLLLKKGITSEEIVEIIQQLHVQAKQNAKAIRITDAKFKDWIGSVNKMLILFEESVKEGWSALEVEEASVIVLAEKLAVLKNAIEEALNEMLPSRIKADGKFIKSFGKIVYTVLIQEKSVSFLSFASLFISVGNTFYNIISSYTDMKALTEEMKECKVEFSLKQQALAQTKALLQLLQVLEVRLDNLKSEFDGIIDIWDKEETYISDLLESYRKGADPQKTVLVRDNATWQTNAKYAKSFLYGDEKSQEFEIIL